MSDRRGDEDVGIDDYSHKMPSASSPASSHGLDLFDGERHGVLFGKVRIGRSHRGEVFVGTFREVFPSRLAAHSESVADLTSNRTSHTRTDGSSVDYTVDAAGQLVTDTDGVTYSYDGSGNLTGTSAGDIYGWDDYGRLSTATVDGSPQTYTGWAEYLILVVRSGPEEVLIWETVDRTSNGVERIDSEVFLATLVEASCEEDTVALVRELRSHAW